MLAAPLQVSVASELWGFRGGVWGWGLCIANVLKPVSVLAHDTGEWPMKDWMGYWGFGGGGGGLRKANTLQPYLIPGAGGPGISACCNGHDQEFSNQLQSANQPHG